MRLLNNSKNMTHAKSQNDLKTDSLRLGGLARDDFSDVSTYKETVEYIFS